MSNTITEHHCTTLDFARQYVRRGWAIIPVPAGKKKAILTDWPNLRLTKQDLPRHFNTRGNIGILCGAPSGNLVDVDCDAPEAVAAARIFLPPTALIHGRPGKPRSHYWYIADVVSKEYQFTHGSDETPTMLVELRSAGRQTVVPPSMHPNGEPYIWHQDAEPAVVHPSALQRAVARVAASALIARHWPPIGSRDTAALALCGMLLRAGWSTDEVSQFVQAVAETAGDEEWSKRDKAGRTAMNLQMGKPVFGAPKLEELLHNGERVVSKAREWLQLERPSLKQFDAQTPIVLSNSYSTPRWPEPLREAALYGLAGDTVRLLEPHTEADPVALLLQFHTYFGTTIGSRPHWKHEETKHALNLYSVLVGPSGSGRKGTSRDRIHALFQLVDPDWAVNGVLSGLSSGEGLIAAVRDHDDETPAMVRDKRTLVFESEFAGPLQQMKRDGNILSVILRQLWDSDSVQTLTRSDPLRATGVHLALIGHITCDDLVRYMTTTLAGNGLGNRILWAAVRRSKLLPFGGEARPNGIDEIVQRLHEAVAFARNVDRIDMSEGAGRLWTHAYKLLSHDDDDRPGLFGKLTGRAPAQTLRLACLYALLDQSRVVDIPHLRAALALWEYCEQSVQYAFGDSLGDRIADAVLTHLRAAGTDGMTTTELYNALGNNLRSSELRRALEELIKYQLVTCHTEPSQGRGTKRAERWIATNRKSNPYAGTNYEFDELSTSGSEAVCDISMATDPRLNSANGTADTGEAPREQHGNADVRRCLRCGAPMRRHPDGGYILTCSCATSGGWVA